MWAGGSPAYKTGFGLHAVSRAGMDANSQAAARIFTRTSFDRGWIVAGSWRDKRPDST